MANYLAMNRDELTAEKAALEAKYKEFQAKGLKLNMARGKPGPHQMDLAMDLLKMNDYTTDAGTDARNYGELEGLQEARVLFADVFGVKPEEVFVGGNSSLQLMYNLINIGYVFGFPESPCPWSQVEKRKFLCPVPGYDRHFAITEEFGFELISVPMTPNGPDMDIVEKLVAEDPDIKGIWCVPQYSNPDGYTYSDETIERFAKMKTAAPDFKIFWDEAYIVHHLTDEIIETPVLLNESKKYGNENRVFMFTSTSKITFPGAASAAHPWLLQKPGLWYQLPAGSRVYCGLRPPGVFPGGVVHQSRGAVWRKWPGGALGLGTSECAAVQKQYAGLPDAVRAQRQDPAGSPDGK